MADMWQYDYVQGPERKIDRLVELLNAKGRDGWEAFASIGIKKGITTDEATILLKRKGTA
jgi:hypothetical protein